MAEKDEFDKQFKELGAQIVSMREELKVLQDSPRADPNELKDLKEAFAALTKKWDAMLVESIITPKSKPKDPEPSPELAQKFPGGFGFFSFK